MVLVCTIRSHPKLVWPLSVSPYRRIPLPFCVHQAGYQIKMVTWKGLLLGLYMAFYWFGKIGSES